MARVARFNITRVAAIDTPAVISYATASGSAIAGVNFTATSGSLTFLPGESSKHVDVALSELAVDSPVDFYLNISSDWPNRVARSQGIFVINPQSSEDQYALTSVLFYPGEKHPSEPNNTLEPSEIGIYSGGALVQSLGIHGQISIDYGPDMVARSETEPPEIADGIWLHYYFQKDSGASWVLVMVLADTPTIPPPGAEVTPTLINWSEGKMPIALEFYKGQRFEVRAVLTDITQASMSSMVFDDAEFELPDRYELLFNYELQE